MSPNKFEVLRDELMETILLSLQRHPTQLQTTVKIIIELIGYHKGLLSLTQANCSINERLQFFLEVYAQAEAEKQLTHIY